MQCRAAASTRRTRLTRRCTGHTVRPRLRGPAPARAQKRNHLATVTPPTYTQTMSLKITQLPSNEQIDAAANQRIQRRRDTGRALVEVATQLQQAQSEVEKLTAQYSDVYRDATTDAWTTKELAAQGLPTPVQPVVRRRRRKNTAADSEGTAQ